MIYSQIFSQILYFPSTIFIYIESKIYFLKIINIFENNIISVEPSPGSMVSIKEGSLFVLFATLRSLKTIGLFVKLLVSLESS